MEEEILKRLQKAEIISVLISAKYLTSLKDNHLIELEMTNAVKRHTKGEARVIPVNSALVRGKIHPFLPSSRFYRT